VKPRVSGARAAEAARATSAALVLAAAAYGFLAQGNAPDRARGLVASWQLLPRLVAAAAGAGAVALAVVLAILALSALLGRWYCAALCPLGSLQDLAAGLGGRKGKYRASPTAARFLSGTIAIALALAGAMAAASWLDPWSLFGRFMAWDLRPIALVSSRADVPGFEAWTAIAATAAMAAILTLAIFKGRWFCGTLCPVGSVLGLLNRAAPFRLRLETAACVSCGACEERCPASCIDPASGRIDYSRCVYCLACVGACKTKALYYGRARRAAPKAGLRRGMTRLSFLSSLGGGAAALALAALPGRALASRLTAPALPTTPPGSRSLARFLDSCTACGLCASACPSAVLQPSLGQLGLRGLLVPRLDFGISYCQYECVTCLTVCPSGALERMPLERKKLVKIGDAALVRDLCIVFTDKTKCGACAEHCPTGAVRMIDSATGIPEPLFTTSICIGCGACHHACPVRPARAITVAGLPLHALASKPTPALLGESEPGPSAAGSGGAPAPATDFPF
jgi:ferredoxin